ncbi:spore germination protein [Neobacillus niacini]|uniref:spore germination protein n=1 Tax=Neobacillus niacini TaxID=86668 RepID=UPI002FFD5A85
MEPSTKDGLKTSLQQNIQALKDTLGKSSDIIIREIRFGKEGTIKAGVIYTDGLTNTPSLQNFILETLMLDIKEIDLQKKKFPEQNLIRVLKDVALTVGEIKEETSFDVILTSLLSGDTIILLDGYAQGLIISNRQWAERGVNLRVILLRTGAIIEDRSCHFGSFSNCVNKQVC